MAHLSCLLRCKLTGVYEGRDGSRAQLEPLTANLQLINLALGDDRVLYEVRSQGVEAPDRRAPWRRGYNTGRHRCDVEDGSGSTCSSVARLASLQGGHVIGYARVTMNRCKALTTIWDTPKNTPLMSSFRTSNSYFIQIHGSSTSTKITSTPNNASPLCLVQSRHM